MKKMTRLILISAVLATSGLTAKIANENYKAAITNDERIHKAYENAKKPNKAAILEAIVDAANADGDERIQKAVIIDPDEPKVVRIKTKVTTSAGVSPLSPTMNEKTVNKAEEFIEKVAHPGEVVVEKNLNFTTENISTQELTYETKNIFPEFEEFEEATEKPLTYKIENIVQSGGASELSLFQSSDETKSYGLCISRRGVYLLTPCTAMERKGVKYYKVGMHCYQPKDQADIGLSVNGSTIDYSALALKKDDTTIIRAMQDYYADNLSYKDLYEIFSGVEKGTYAFKGEFPWK